MDRIRYVNFYKGDIWPKYLVQSWEAFVASNVVVKQDFEVMRVGDRQKSIQFSIENPWQKYKTF